MSLAPRIRPLWLCLVVLLGCDGGPSGPSSGNLRLTVLGLPTTTPAAISITGPDGFSQPASATQTFTQLVPGTYTIAASSVTAGGSTYDPSPANQTVTIVASDGQTSATVFYSQSTGSVSVTVNGLGTSRTAAVTVTGPGGYNQPVDGTTTLPGLDPGDYTITAANTASIGCATHTAAPTTQIVTVVARATASATVTYEAPPNDGSVNLCIAGLYLTQSVQDLGRTVPLVQGRDGYLRVFAVADRANTVAPTVQVRLYNTGVLLSTLTIPPSGFSVPTAIHDSSLALSWDTTIAGTWIQPGFEVEAEVNPSGVVAETNPTDNLYPSTGRLALEVRNVPTLAVTFVPVLQAGNGLIGAVTATNKDAFLASTRKMHPVATIDAALHAPYTTNTNLTLQANNTNGAWGTILEEIDLLRRAETSGRYYYGVARVSYSSGIAGVAYVSLPGTTAGSGQRAALGWDYLPSGSIVAAHELGHNWGRNHAPCGGPAGVDPQYPRPDGSTGVYGMDVAAKTLQASSLPDLMGYCDPKWISDYTYRGVMNYLMAPSPPLLSLVNNSEVQPCLLVWGHIRNGEIFLQPAFQLNARPDLPLRGGAYSMEGRDANGKPIFALSFSPRAVADDPTGQENFVLAVPLSEVRTARLTSIHVAGKGRQVTLTDSAATGAQTGKTSRPDTVELRRVASDRVVLRWDDRVTPMIMVRDPETGEVLSLARGGEIELSTGKRELDLIMSNGVRSKGRRMQVAP